MRIERIVAGMDFSAPAMWELTSSSLALTATADVTLVHVLSRGQYGHSEVMAEVLIADDAAAARRLEEEAEAVGSTANAVLHGATCPVLVVTESRDAVVQSR